MFQRFFSLILFWALPATVLAGPRQLVVDTAASSVTFDVRATMHSFTGKDEAWTVEITFPTEGDLPDSATFTTELAAMKTGNAKRDAEMLHWMENEQYPTISFRLTSIAPDGAAHKADGELTLHGQTRAISIPVTITRQSGRTTVAGEITIDHRQWGLKQFRKMGFLTVSPEVKVAFKIVGEVR